MTENHIPAGSHIPRLTHPNPSDRKGPDMAEIDPTELVTVRHPATGEEKEIPRGAVPYFPEYVQLKSNGTVNPNPATPKG
jgi:hypothetical protein